ncbi:MAG: type II secretion system F family protein [Betaproteobacteria bacterium]
MPSYGYRGRNAGGDLVQGVLEAASPGAAADALSGQGVTPLEIAETAVRATVGKGSALEFFKPKVETLEVMLFSRQMYTLLKAGVPIMRALNGLQESVDNPTMKEVIQEVRTSLDSGRELSLSLARRPKVFGAFYVSMIRVGEMTGRLEEVFLSLYQHLEFEKFMRDQVKAALRYPSFVIAAMAGAIVIVNLFVIPTFAKVFSGFGAELPLMTRSLIGFSSFMVNQGWLLAIIIAGALFLFRNWISTTKGRFTWDRFKLRIPLAGKIVRKATLARFSRSMALALKSGVPITQALSVVAQTVDNALIVAKIEGMREGVERGDSILRTAAATGVFTPVVMQMIAVGEESGSLDEMMQEVADLYRQEVEYEIRTLGQQIEPILLFFLAILVLILALGIFLPIWDLGRAAGGRG